MDHAADLANLVNWIELTENFSILATQLPAINKIEAWHDQNAYNLHTATHLKFLQNDIPQTPAFNMAACDSQNGTISNQNFGKKNFGKLLLIHQIRQIFSPPKFSSIQSILLNMRQ